MSGEIHIGMLAYFYFSTALSIGTGSRTIPAGRLNEAPSVGLSKSLNLAGFKLGRLQTGTPARLDKKTINFGKTEQIDGDSSPKPFSFMSKAVDNAVWRHNYTSI